MRRALAVLAAIALSSCGGNATPPPAPQGPSPDVLRAAFNQGVIGKHIKHLVIVIQENRSFDNFFAGWPHADTRMAGLTSLGPVKLKPITFDGPDISHGWADAIAAWDNGKMDGFEKEQSSSLGPIGLYPYSYVEHSLIEPYRSMAKQYVLADHMFQTEFGGSFTAHLDLIAGTANISPTLTEVNWPSTSSIWGCDSPAGTTSQLLNQQRQISYTSGPFPCFTQFNTLAGTLDAKHVSWRYYAVALGVFGGWSSFDAIRSVRYGNDWKNVVSPPSRFLKDANAGLPGVTWVTPDLQDSDHAGNHSSTGPSWVASVVNAVGRSKDWKSTAIVVIWDDWGGWYDNVPPPQKDFVGLGERVPCIIISPYARAGYVSHTQYEFGSIMKFAEEVFGLAPIGDASFGYTDARANSLADSFDFAQKPRAFVPIKASHSADFFLTRKGSTEVPDDQ